MSPWKFAVAAISTFIVVSSLITACDTGGDDDDAAPNDDDDDVSDDDSDDDDDAADDDDAEDLYSDTYVAPWPQNTVEDPDYDESPEAGLMRIKAQAYDLWHEDNHQPFYGSTLGVMFTDDSRGEVEYWFDTYDSCMWTGTYLGGEAFRYYVTADPQAKANAIRSVEALDGHLHVTGKPGYIARFRGPQDPHVLPGECYGHPNCHILDEGPYAGDWWWGDTSRDQFTGWFFGMSLAYDLVDDEEMRQTIREDVIEVLDELIAHNWLIMDVDGLPTSTFNVLPTMQLNWSLIGYHITGEERYKEQVQRWLRDDKRFHFRLMNIAFFNRYSDHYGNNLGHENFYNLLRLARVYVGPSDYQFLLEVFENQQHSVMRLAHNAFFTAIHMSQGIYEPDPDDDPYQAQLEEDLTDFRPAPNYQYHTTPPPAELDPVSVWLHEFMQSHPWLLELLGDIGVQALYAFPVQYQCSTDFLWQRNPWALSCGEQEMPRKVQPGVDYITAYWMASYHKFLSKDQ